MIEDLLELSDVFDGFPGSGGWQCIVRAGRILLEMSRGGIR